MTVIVLSHGAVGGGLYETPHVKHFAGRLAHSECSTSVSYIYGKESGLRPKKETCRVFEERRQCGSERRQGDPLHVGHQVQVSEDGGLGVE